MESPVESPVESRAAAEDEGTAVTAEALIPILTIDIRNNELTGEIVSSPKLQLQLVGDSLGFQDSKDAVEHKLKNKSFSDNLCCRLVVKKEEDSLQQSILSSEDEDDGAMKEELKTVGTLSVTVKMWYE